MYTDLAAKDFVDASDGRYKYKEKLPELGTMHAAGGSYNKGESREVVE